MRSRHLTSLSLVCVVLAWVALARGLMFLPPSTDPLLDLEPPHWFAFTVAVYWPGQMLLLLLPFLLLIGMVARATGASIIVVAVLTTVFGGWVLGQDALLDYFPGLEAHVGWAMVLGATAGVVPVASRAAMRCTRTTESAHRAT